MRSIVKIIKTEQKTSKYNKKFYLSSVLLDDDETYSLASSKLPVIGDEVEAFYHDVYQKPVAVYPKKTLDNNNAIK